MAPSAHFKKATTPPEGWRGDLSFTSTDGHRIRYGHAPANPDRSAQGTIVLTHGYGETSDLYYKAIKNYQEAGYEVWAMDWHGHGLSERDNPDNPLLPSSAGLERHVEDLDHFVNHIVNPARDQNKPLIMSTHSMGGHIGLLHLHRHPGKFDAAVMSAPMLDIWRLGLPPSFRPAVRRIFQAAANMGLRDVELPGEVPLLARVKAVGESLRNMAGRAVNITPDWKETIRDSLPDSRLGRPTFGWVAAAYDTILPSIDKEFLESIEPPVLIGSAGIENLVDNKAHEYAASVMPRATHVNIPDAVHGIWGTQGQVFQSWWSEVENFIAQAPQTPAPTDQPQMAPRHDPRLS